jgi:beta-lactamase superfamily II metal-dependent hydrolase
MFLYIFTLIINTYNCNKKTKIETKNTQKNNIVHFIKCGHGDSILVEGKGHFGLIDSANPIIGKNNFKDKNVFFVLKYLKKLKVQKLDFIIGTHSHSDHIGGIKEITYEYVDNSTIYYYKKLNINLNLDKYINYKDYLNVMDSIKKKNATLVDVTNKKIIFNVGDILLTLLNTYNSNKILLDENQNSIITLIKYKNIKIVLPGDMTNDYNIISHFGDINILKFPHHGFGDISINNLRKLKPAHIIISSDYIYPKAFKLKFLFY